MATKFSLILLSLLLISVLSQEQKKRYDGYQVIRFNTSQSHADFFSHKKFYTVAQNHLLDVWGSNYDEGWMDVMVNPEQQSTISALFKGIPHSVAINDVQQHIDENEQLRQSKAPTAFFDEFQTYDIIAQFLQEQADNSQGLATRISIGNSYNGNPIYALHIQGPGGEKPTFVIQGGIHAREWISPSSCCWIIDQLLNHDSSRDVILQHFDFIVIPVLNVDGYMYTHSNDRLWRKNRRPNSGSGCIGTDLNRNYDNHWGESGASPSPCSETYYGTAPFSEPESKAVDSLFNSLAKVEAFIDVHSYGGMWMSPWGYTCNSLPSDYAEMYAYMQDSVAEILKVDNRAYSFGSACRVIYQTSGDCCDWAYASHQVILSIAVEIYGSTFLERPDRIPVRGAEMWAGVKTSALKRISGK